MKAGNNRIGQTNVIRHQLRNTPLSIAVKAHANDAMVSGTIQPINPSTPQGSLFKSQAAHKRRPKCIKNAGATIH
jgi:hypothetical protein